MAQPIKDDQSIINLSKLPSVDEVIAKVEKENNLDVNQSKTIAPISIEKSSYNLPKPKGNGKFDRIAPDTPKEKSTPNNMQTQQSNKQFTNDPSVPTLQSRVGIIQREIALPTESQLKTLGDALLKKPTQHTNNNASNVTEVPTIPRSYITPHNSTRGKRFQVRIKQCLNTSLIQMLMLPFHVNIYVYSSCLLSAHVFVLMLYLYCTCAGRGNFVKTARDPSHVLRFTERGFRAGYGDCYGS